MRDWSRGPHLPRCDMCSERKPDVLRFGLVRRARTPKGNQTSKGAGGIWLCKLCWDGLVPLRQRDARPIRVAS